MQYFIRFLFWDSIKKVLSQQPLVTQTVRKSQGTSLLKKKKKIFRLFGCTICHCWICSFPNVHGQGINKYSLFIPATGIFICSKTFWILKLQIWSSVTGIRYWLQSLLPNIKQDPVKFESIYFGEAKECSPACCYFWNCLAFQSIVTKELKHMGKF